MLNDTWQILELVLVINRLLDYALVYGLHKIGVPKNDFEELTLEEVLKLGHLSIFLEIIEVLLRYFAIRKFEL